MQDSISNPRLPSGQKPQVEGRRSRCRSRGVVAALAMLVAVSNATASADDKFDSASQAKIIAPWIDEQTLVIAHVDLRRVSADAVLEQLAPLKLHSAEELTAMKAIAGMFQQALITAGVKDGYVMLSLSDGIMRPRAFGVIPLAADSNDTAVRTLLSMDAVERRGDVLLVAADRQVLHRITQGKPDARPDLQAAIEAAGDTGVQLLLLPPKDYRRVAEEAIGEMPKDLGGGSVKVFTRGIRWLAAGIDLKPQPSVKLTIQSDDAPAAQALRDKLAELLQLAAKNGSARKLVPQIDEIVAMLVPTVDGDRLHVVLDEKNHGVERLIKSLVGPVESGRVRSGMVQSANNLKQIAIGIVVYADRNGHFPLPAISSKDGKPLLSWRVQILPFIEQGELYKQFHLDEPWDSPNNRKLIDKMPAIYRMPATQNKEPGKTNYLLPVGNGAVFLADKPTDFRDITDGTSNTIMVVETDDENAVIWTKPGDLAFDPESPTKGLGRFHGGRFYAAFCDGHVSLLPAAIDAKTLKALFTRAGGEVVDPH